MTGPLVLHGGGEFLPGDEPVLRAILEAIRGPLQRQIRGVIIATAAARGRPDLAVANGVDALRQIAREAGMAATFAGVPILDAASAADATLVARIAGADVIYLPGGDPDLIPAILAGSPAWTAILDAWHGGAVLAGASAGAMALAAWCWTPTGLVRGLDLVPGVVVAPHADAGSWARYLARFGSQVPADLGILGLGERTALIGRPGETWRVVGAGEVRWLAGSVTKPLIARHGDTISLDGESSSGARHPQ